MQFFKKNALFFLMVISFNFFASEESSKKSCSDSAYSWLQESNKNHPRVWKCIFLASGMGCATGLVISSLKSGLYLLYTIKEVFSKQGLMESSEEQEQRVLSKFYKMIASLFSVPLFLAGVKFFDDISDNLKNNLPIFRLPVFLQ